MSMAPSVLPDYSEDIQFSSSMARQDRLEVELGDWIIHAPRDEARSFCTILPAVAGIHNPQQGQIDFLRVPTGRFPRLKFGVRSSRGSRGGALAPGQPTFSGDLEFYQPRSPDGQPYDPNIWALGAKLVLNPTVWIAHLGTGQVRTPAHEWPVHAARVFAQQPPLYTWERPLVPAANVIVGTPRHLGLMRPGHWRDVIRNYVLSVREAFEMVIQSAVADVGLPPAEFRPFVKAKEFETHWEFSARRPLQEMERLERQLRSLVAVSQVGWTQIQHEAGNGLPALEDIYVGADHNSPCLRVNWGKRAFLRIYAKTTSRLRFELVHKVKECPQVFPQRTATSYEALLEWLDRASEDAAEKIGGLLVRMRGNASGSSETPHKRPHELVSDIFVALAGLSQAGGTPATETDVAQHIVEQLVVNGRIALAENDPQRPAIERLRNRQILRRSGQEGTTHVYVPCTAYTAALERLRHSG